MTARANLLRSVAPLLVAVLAVLLVWAAGFTERSFIGTALEDHFYGFFFRNYPLLLFAIAYGVARIVAAATEPGRARGLRAFTTPLAVALFLIAHLYPTFGGVVARPGYAVAGMSFLQGQPAELALVLGAGAAALVYGLCLGAAVILGRLRLRWHWTALGFVVLSYLALWLGAVILLGSVRWGGDILAGWPVRPLAGGAAAKAAAVVALAFLPHACVVAWARRRSPKEQVPDRRR
jgi:hypothetical protein